MPQAELRAGKISDEDLSVIRFIDFAEFKAHGRFPRYPDCNLARPIGRVDRDNAIVIFISHGWLRGDSTCEGWDGLANPDNANNDKFKLCVRGIEKLLTTLDCTDIQCYLWIDYGCMNQDKIEVSEYVQNELSRYDKIIACCDVLFTPIVDEIWQNWELEGAVDLYRNYRAASWMGGDRSYLRRAWCRVEMMYAVSIDVQTNDSRESKFNNVIRRHHKDKFRSHLLYGTKEYVNDSLYHVLEPLQDFFGEYNPAKGSLTKKEDSVHIKFLLDSLGMVVPFRNARNLAINDFFNDHFGR